MKNSFSKETQVMRILTKLTTYLAVFALFAVPAFSDTLILKSGERVSGYFEGGSARVVKFRSNDGLLKDYDILSVQQIQFGDAKTTSTTTSSTRTSSATTSQPRLVPGSDRVTRPTSNSAANTAFTIPTGTKVVVRMIDSVNSETQKIGDQFVAVLDETIYSEGVEVVPRGSDVRGRITNVNEAGRIAGKAELGLELTQIIVNGVPYSLTTQEYSEVGEGRGSQTAKRAGIGAAIGAGIGAIAGGGKGAAIGAGVGAGGATAVQVLTKGEKLNIPSETKLEFTLRAPLVVAAR
jgi:hypothetical protein